MRAPILILITVLAGPLPSVGSDAATGTAAGGEHDIGRLAWLAGCWERDGAERYTLEHWTAPRGGMMLGLNQTTARGRTLAWEYLRIASVDGKLVLTALPSSQSETSFDAVELTDSSVVFRNPEHDFPQTVSYRLRPDGSLLGRIEGTEDGRARSVDFPFDPVKCDLAPRQAEPPVRPSTTPVRHRASPIRDA